MKARSPKEFTDVRDVNESENNSCLSRCMTIKANKIDREGRTWANHVASEIAFLA